MFVDPTQRFSSRVADYVRYRPSYPAEVVDLLARECSLTASSVVADIGSGTGLLAEVILKSGCEVIGVEPNPDMRAAAETLLDGVARFRNVDGRAEHTTLSCDSVDIITAGQAFHWFEPTQSRAEFLRILRPHGWVALVWNERIVSDDPFLAGYEQLLQRYAPEYLKVDHRRIDSEAITRFFGHDVWRTAVFPNEQHFDLEGICGRLRSSSYTPHAGSPSYDAMICDLKRLFHSCQQQGSIAFLYDTKVYYGMLD